VCRRRERFGFGRRRKNHDQPTGRRIGSASRPGPDEPWSEVLFRPSRATMGLPGPI
jgi:hypothetical protein